MVNAGHLKNSTKPPKAPFESHNAHNAAKFTSPSTKRPTKQCISEIIIFFRGCKIHSTPSSCWRYCANERENGEREKTLASALSAVYQEFKLHEVRRWSSQSLVSHRKYNKYQFCVNFKYFARWLIAKMWAWEETRNWRKRRMGMIERVDQ